jgi:farnesyl diphosphate synthase
MDRVVARTQRLSTHILASPAAAGDRLFTGVAPEMTSSKSAKDAEKKRALDDFVAVFHTLSNELLADLSNFEMSGVTRAYIEKMIKHTVEGGKMNRGLTVVSSYKALVGARALTKEEYFKAAALGWCLEWLQAFFLVADDIMDNSITRRGVPCWYRLPDVGTDAINDSFLLESHVFRILRRYFHGAPYYATLLDLFHEVIYQTELGQLLDLKTAPPKSIDLSRFTQEKYDLIVKYKTAYYSFYMPVALGMIMAGVTAPSAFRTAERITVKMGTYFQIQDDYLDCYADPEVLGKIGTDIQDNKCSWLVVQALSRCSPAQRAILEANYARDDEACVHTIKQLYRDLNLEAVFQAYEARVIGELETEISQVTEVPPAVFHDLLAKIAKREK